MAHAHAHAHAHGRAHPALPVEPEVHFVGQLVSAQLPSTASTSALSAPLNNAFASFAVEAGAMWTCVGGEEEGQTQVDYPQSAPSSSWIGSFLHAVLDGGSVSTSSSTASSSVCVWNHPIDLHYYSRSMVGWPQIVLQVYTLDQFGGPQLVGYGFTNFPTSSGSHTLSIPLFRPVAPLASELSSFFLSSSSALLDTGVINRAEKAKEDRCHLWTKGVGEAIVQLDVVLRGWDKHNVV